MATSAPDLAPAHRWCQQHTQIPALALPQTIAFEHCYHLLVPRRHSCERDGLPPQALCSEFHPYDGKQKCTACYSSELEFAQSSDTGQIYTVSSRNLWRSKSKTHLTQAHLWTTGMNATRDLGHVGGATHCHVLRRASCPLLNKPPPGSRRWVSCPHLTVWEGGYRESPGTPGPFLKSCQVGDATGIEGSI